MRCTSKPNSIVSEPKRFRSEQNHHAGLLNQYRGPWCPSITLVFVALATLCASRSVPASASAVSTPTPHVNPLRIPSELVILPCWANSGSVPTASICRAVKSAANLLNRFYGRFFVRWDRCVFTSVETWLALRSTTKWLILGCFRMTFETLVSKSRSSLLHSLTNQASL